MANLKSINSLSDINLDKMKSKDAMLIIETLHKMSYNIPNNMKLGEEVRKFFQEIDSNAK